MLHEGLAAELISNTAVATFVVTPGAAYARVFPLVIPQKKPNGDAQVPAVVYSQISVEHQVTYCGTTGVARTIMRIDSYAKTYNEAKQLGAAVKAALIDYRGRLGNLVDLRAASLESELDLHDFEPGLYRVSQTWVFWHKDTE